MVYVSPYLLTSFAHTVYRFFYCINDCTFVYPMCNSVLLFVSHCFALSWPGRRCKWEKKDLKKIGTKIIEQGLVSQSLGSWWWETEAFWSLWGFHQLFRKPVHYSELLTQCKLVISAGQTLTLKSRVWCSYRRFLHNISYIRVAVVSRLFSVSYCYRFAPSIVLPFFWSEKCCFFAVRNCESMTLFRIEAYTLLNKTNCLNINVHKVCCLYFQNKMPSAGFNPIHCGLRVILSLSPTLPSKLPIRWHYMNKS